MADQPPVATTSDEVPQQAVGRTEKLLEDLRTHQRELEATRAVSDEVRLEGLRRLGAVIGAAEGVLERFRVLGTDACNGSGR